MQCIPCLFGGIFVVVLIILYIDVSVIMKHQPTFHLQNKEIILNDDINKDTYQQERIVSPGNNLVQSEIPTILINNLSYVNQESINTSTEGPIYRILTYYLKDEDDIDTREAIQHNQGWQERYDTLLQEIQSDYIQSSDRVFDSMTKDTAYSSYQIEWIEHMNSAYIYTNHICRDFQTGHFYFYTNRSKEINFKQVAHQFFRWGWHLKFKHEPLPQHGTFVEEEDYMIFQPFLPRHITHFAECVNHLLNKLGNRTSYTHVSHVYLPLLEEENEFEWTKTYMSLLLSLFPETHRPQLHFSRNTTNHSDLECFHSATLVDRLAYNKDGGIFGGFFPQDMMRGIAYRYASVQPKQQEHIIQMLFLERSRGRKWMRKHTYLKLLKQFYPKMNITVSSVGGLSFKNQILLYYQTDILLGGHGSAMTNAMFMLPHSVLIECNPPFFYEMCFANIAWLSRVHYISVTNFNAQHLPNKLKNVEKDYQSGLFFRRRREFAQYNIYPDPLQVVSAVDDAIQYVYRWKFYFSAGHEWSRVFY